MSNYLASRPVRPQLDDTDPNGAKRRVTATLAGYAATSMLVDLAAEMVTATLPLYLVAAGLTISVIAGLEAFSELIQAGLRVYGGHIAATTNNPRRTALAGYTASMICRALIMIPAVPVIAAASLIDRFGKAYRVAPRDTLIAAEADRAHIPIPAAFAFHRRFDTLGATAGPLAAAALLAAKPGAYTAVFAVAVAVAAIGVCVFARVSPHTPATPAATETTPANTPQSRLVPAARGALTGLATIPLPVVILTVTEGTDRFRLPLWVFLASIVFLIAAGTGTKLVAKLHTHSLVAAPTIGATAAAVAALPHSPYTPAIIAVLTGLQLCVADPALVAITALEDPNPARLGWSTGGLAFGRSVGLAATALFGGFTLPWVIPTCAVAAVGLAAINRHTGRSE